MPPAPGRLCVPLKYDAGVLYTSFGSKGSGPSIPDPVCAFKEPGVERGTKCFAGKGATNRVVSLV